MRLLFLIFIYLAASYALPVQATSISRKATQISTTTINAKNLALVVNRNDPSSISVSKQYQVKHKIPQSNIIFVSIKNPKSRLKSSDFFKLNREIKRQLNSNHKAVLFVWSKPYAVACHSITAAFTLGFNSNLCSHTCSPSKQNPYFNQASNKPLKDFAMRLSMLLPTDDFETASKVIDNGVNSQAGVFKSTAYFVKTSDAARNARAKFFPKNGLSFNGLGLSVKTLATEKLEGIHDIMIYHTGKAWVEGLSSLNFLPGALADHLTSYGGDLVGQSQMTVLDWLKAGATASYGTVSEPCNHWQKFPHSTALLKWYANGATAIEAYWKSVAWPAQGLFVGDPLAAPYAK